MNSTRVISEKKKLIYICRNSPQRLIEDASIEATKLACIEFGIDEYGHSNMISEWERSSCSIQIEFVGIKISGGPGGWEYNVSFYAWCEKHQDCEG
jgi:hypothetical protein